MVEREVQEKRGDISFLTTGKGVQKKF